MLIAGATGDIGAALPNLFASLLGRQEELSLLVAEGQAGALPKVEQGSAQVLYVPAPKSARLAASRFLGDWHPEIVLFFGGGFDTTLAGECAERGIPTFLFCETVPEAAPRMLLRQLSGVFAPSARQATALRRLGVPDAAILLTGNLSTDRPPPTCNEQEQAAMSAQVSGRPMWLALDIDESEVPPLIAAHSASARLAHRLLLVLVPRQQHSGPDIAERLRTAGWQVALRSQDDDITEETQIYLADTEGEQSLWLRLSPVTFLGGSLAPVGSEVPVADPAAPAALGSALIHGPRLGAHSRFLNRLVSENAARVVYDDAGLARVLEQLIAPDKAAEQARNAWDVATEGAEATERVVSRLSEVLRPRKQRK